jgi:hypothetical protein
LDEDVEKKLVIKDDVEMGDDGDGNAGEADGKALVKSEET